MNVELKAGSVFLPLIMMVNAACSNEVCRPQDVPAGGKAEICLSPGQDPKNRGRQRLSLDPDFVESPGRYYSFFTDHGMNLTTSIARDGRRGSIISSIQNSDGVFSGYGQSLIENVDFRSGHSVEIKWNGSQITEIKWDGRNLQVRPAPIDLNTLPL